MPSLDEYAGIEPEVEAAAAAAADPQPEVQQRPRFQLPEWMKAKSSREPIEQYIDHPLNFDRDPDLARAVRGATSMFNALDYAIIDVVVGLLRYMKKRKQPINVGGSLPGAGS